MRTAVAIARPNIALIKYWGKRDSLRNLPATGSLSLTLGRLHTRTRVQFSGALSRDRLWIDGQEVPEGQARPTLRVLDELRRLAGVGDHAEVVSENTMPTAAGLASSASGMAALVTAAAAALGLPADLLLHSRLARIGSGSAPRSLLGGLVVLPRGDHPEGQDCVPRQLRRPEEIPWSLLIVLTTVGPKAKGSTEAMEHTRRTAPYYEAWVRQSALDLEAAIPLAQALDLEALGPLVEANGLAMHACMISARPAIRYWAPTTLTVMDAVLGARAEGLCGFFTIDAGPHVKVLCHRRDAPAWLDRLQRVPGVAGVLLEEPGEGPEVLP